jgi:filamentous hemagglutinin family protein
MSHPSHPAAARRAQLQSSRRAVPPFRLRRLAIALAGVSLSSLLPGLNAAQAQALPSGLAVMQGQANAVVSGNKMTVTNSANAILNWKSFSIGANQAVRFEQPGAASQVLNRVVGNDPSRILGSLSSNGKVWLLNPNGVLFGQGARIDVAGLVASTLNLSDADWQAGRYRLTSATPAAGEAAVVNQGEIRSTSGGRVLLLAGAGGVRNEGLIETPDGQLVLAAGHSIDLVDSGAPNVVVRVTAPQGQALNLGTLSAANGRVDMQAAIVNQQGIVRADAFATGPGGEVLLRASEAVNIAAASTTSANGASGGHVTVDAGSGTALVAGAVGATGNEGRGGNVELLGRHVGVVGSARVDASGRRGGGQVLVGGGMQGKDATVPNAQAAFVGAEATIAADATENGDGGRVVVWSDEATRAYGRFSAQGGPLGGNGGWIETSGGWLDARPASIATFAPKGKAGTWLLDPFDINIVDATTAPSNASFLQTGTDFTITSIGQPATILSSTIAGALDGRFSEICLVGACGTNVIVSTGAGGAALGNIVMSNAHIEAVPDHAVSLTMNAHGNIVVNGNSTIQNFSSSNPTVVGAPLSVVLNAGLGGSGRILVDSSSIITGGGDITLGGPTRPRGNNAASPFAGAVGYDVGIRDFAGDSIGVRALGSTLDAGSGRITMNGTSIAQDKFSSGVSIESSTLAAGRIDLNGWADTNSASNMVRLNNSTLKASGGAVNINASGTSNGEIIIDPESGTGYFPRGVLIDGQTFLSADRDVTIQGRVSSTYTGAGSVIGVHVAGSSIQAGGNLSSDGASSRTGVAVANANLAASGSMTLQAPVGGGDAEVFASTLRATTLSLTADAIDLNGALLSAAGDVFIGATGGTGARIGNIVMSNSSIEAVAATPAKVTLDADANLDMLSGSVISNVVPTNLDNFGGLLAVSLDSVGPPLATALDVVGAPIAIALSAGRSGTGSILLSTARVASGGGDVTLGGPTQPSGASGATSPFAGAVGYDPSEGDSRGAAIGVRLIGATLDAGGGNLALNGTSIAQNQFSSGVSVEGSTLGAGRIAINGWADTDSASHFVRLNNSSLTASGGPVTITASGTSNGAIVTDPTTGAGFFPRAVMIDGKSSIDATGDVTIQGTIDSTFNGVQTVMGIGIDDSSIRSSGGDLALTGSSPLRGVGTSRAASLSAAGSIVVATPSGRGDAALFSSTLTATDVSVASDSANLIGTTVAASRNVSLSGTGSAGSVDLSSGSTVNAGGDVTVTASGNGASISAARSTLTAGNAITFSSPGPNASISLVESRVNAGRTASMTAGGANGSIDFIDSSVTSGGGVSLAATGSAGSIDLQASPVSAQGDISIASGAGGFTDIDDAVTAGGRVALRADALSLLVQDGPARARISAAAPADAITVAGAANGSNVQEFFNDAGAPALSTPNGRWLVYAVSPDPSGFDAGGLAHDFRQYDARFGAATVVNGNIVTPNPGNGLLFDVRPALTLSGTPTKVYDGRVEATIAGSALGVGGLLAGDSAVVAPTLGGSFSDPNAGTGKPFRVDAGSISFADALGKPVFGYALDLAMTGTIRPKVLIAPVVAAADKAYDGNVDAALTPGALSGLVGAQTLGLAATGRFFDKNASTAPKPVEVTLTLADGNNGGLAGNYAFDDAGNRSIAVDGVTARITPKVLGAPAVSAANKAYDGTTAAQLAVGPLAGLVGAETLAVGATGSFTDKNAAAAPQAVNVTLSLADGSNGGLANNYAFDAAGNRVTAVDGVTARITPKLIGTPTVVASNKAYDGTTDAALTVGALAGLVGSETLGVGAAGRFDDKNASALAQPVHATLTLADGGNGGLASNYAFDAAGNRVAAIDGLSAFITPKVLATPAVSTADKRYDGNTDATVSVGALSGLVGAETLAVGAKGVFEDRNASSQSKTVDVTLSLADAGNGGLASNYRLAASQVLSSAHIDPATLTFVANPATLVAGAPLSTLSGSVTGFVAGDTLTSATSGRLEFTTPANARSLPGRYAINGSGLASTNYVFEQDPGNALALTLMPLSLPEERVVRLNDGYRAVSLQPGVSSPGKGRVLDATQALRWTAADPGSAFRSIPVAQMTEESLEALLASREEYKKALFKDAIAELEQNPELADVPVCQTVKQMQSGVCLVTDTLKSEVVAARAAIAGPTVARSDVTPADVAGSGPLDIAPAAVNPNKPQPVLAPSATAASELAPMLFAKRKVRNAALPQIERKLAVVIGTDKYSDARIPQLENAVSDARAVGQLLETALGYQTIVIENGTKEAIIRTLNELATEVDAKDSVIVYYAGHGELVPGTGLGYWQPANADASRPQTWLSNTDIGKLLGQLGASQIALISDSCYSGTLVTGARIRGTGDEIDPSAVLSRKTAVVMSSGGNEPVFDSGKDGHSLFAWNLMRNLEKVSNWQAGGNVFERIRFAVARELPQRPQYGASPLAGHEPGTDYLFEQRQLDVAR